MQNSSHSNHDEFECESPCKFIIYNTELICNTGSIIAKQHQIINSLIENQSPDLMNRYAQVPFRVPGRVRMISCRQNMKIRSGDGHKSIGNGRKTVENGQTNSRKWSNNGRKWSNKQSEMVEKRSEMVEKRSEMVEKRSERGRTIVGK